MAERSLRVTVTFNYNTLIDIFLTLLLPKHCLATSSLIKLVAPVAITIDRSPSSCTNTKDCLKENVKLELDFIKRC